MRQNRSDFEGENAYNFDPVSIFPHNRSLLSSLNLPSTPSPFLSRSAERIVSSSSPSPQVSKSTRTNEFYYYPLLRFRRMERNEAKFTTDLESHRAVFVFPLVYYRNIIRKKLITKKLGDERRRDREREKGMRKIRDSQVFPVSVSSIDGESSKFS